MHNDDEDLNRKDYLPPNNFKISKYVTYYTYINSNWIN